MGLLNKLGITTNKNTKAEKIFNEIFPNFLDVPYDKPSEYVQKYWNTYILRSDRNNKLNGIIFEFILATLCIRENMIPFYLEAEVAFVPNVKYDLMFYSSETGPICWSAKTSLRERYKQADLEAIALKYVHRKALSYLITLDTKEAFTVQSKIKSGEVIGINEVIVATSSNFDEFIRKLKKFEFSKPPTVQVINSNHIVTKEKVFKVKVEKREK